MLFAKRTSTKGSLHSTESVRSASVYVAIGFITSQLLRLVSNLILTRLLAPEMFGIMTIVNIVLQGLQMFSDVGIGPSIIQNKDGDRPEFLNTAWTIQAVRGTLLWIVACALSWPIAQIYANPILCPLICVSATSAIFSGLNSTSLFTANRDLLLGRLVAIDLAAQIVGLATTLSLAIATKSIWSLVFAGIATSIIKMVLSHQTLPGVCNKLQLDRRSLSQLLSFGKWVFLSTLIGFIALSADRLYLGLYLKDSLDILGVYSIAFFLSNSAGQFIASISQQVHFPSFSRTARSAPEQLRMTYYTQRMLVVIPSLVIAGVLVTAGDFVVGLLYDKRYEQAGWMLRIMSIKLIFYSSLPPAGAMLLALGKPIYSAISSALTATWITTAIPIGWYLFGLPGVVVMVGLSALPLVPIYWYGLRQKRILCLREEAWLLIPLGLGILIGLAASYIAS